MYASLQGHEAAVRELISRGVNLNQTEPGDKMTALHVAAQTGHVPVMEVLLSHGARHDLRNVLGQAPLHQAVVFGHKDAVNCLLNHGADVNFGDDRGFTPLNFAAQLNQYEIAKLLVRRGANIQQADHYGLTPLHTATSRGYNTMVDYLIKKGANFDCQGDAMGKACKCCGATNVPLQLCSGCRVVWYCSPECQKKDWKEGGENRHKVQCPRIKEQRELYKEKKKEEVKEVEDRLRREMRIETEPSNALLACSSAEQYQEMLRRYGGGARAPPPTHFPLPR